MLRVLQSPLVVTLVAVLGNGCMARPDEVSIDARLELVAIALREGRLEEAVEWIHETRLRDPRHVEAARWSSLIADLLWRDEAAITEQMAAIRLAAGNANHEELAQLKGQLGDQLFQAGRWGESSEPLLAGAGGPDLERRRAFAILAAALPFVRHFAGPLVTEQPLLAGRTPEFVCGTSDRLRPFAIDTGTSMTTVGQSFAEELGVRSKREAGMAVDGAGRDLPIEVGLLPEFRIGNVDIGAVPILIVADQALRLRDLHGGPERVPRGVLGLDLIAACRLTLDPERGSVVLELPQSLPPTDSVQCVRAEGRCLVPVVIEGKRLWFVLDTGASHSSLTTLGLQQMPGGEARASQSYRRVRTVGGGLVAVREVRDLVLRCSEARFLGVTLPVVARGTSSLFPVHGVLGIDLLSRCRVTLDRGRARLAALR
jgi:predicted aspartyl protease